MTIEETQEGLPYTVVGHSAMPMPKMSILLTGEGIIELAKRVKKEDRVRVVQWSDYTDECTTVRYYGKITIIKTENK